MRPSATGGSSPNRATTGKVFVERPEVLDDIIGSLDGRTWANRGVHKKGTTKTGSANQSEHTRLLKEQEMQRAHQTELVMKQNIQKSLEMKKEKEERLFPMLMSNLDKATNFLNVVDKDISLHDETQKNKVRRQFEDWNTTVHGTIQVRRAFRPRSSSCRILTPYPPILQKKIATSINSMDSKALNKKKNEDYEKFLNITNRKPAIFRDIIIESECTVPGEVFPAFQSNI
jgi:hypothetical protein